MSGLEQNQCVAKESVWPFPETLFSEKTPQTPRRKSLRQQRGLFKAYRIRTNWKFSLWNSGSPVSRKCKDDIESAAFWTEKQRTNFPNRKINAYRCPLQRQEKSNVHSK